MKGFNIDFLMMDKVTSFEEDFEDDNASTSTKNKSSPTSTRSKFSKIAQGIANKRRGAKWRQLIEATRNKVIPFSRSQDSIDSDAIGDVVTDSPNPHYTDSTSMRLDANLRRQIYALKLESVSLSQPALQSSAVTAAISSAAGPSSNKPQANQPNQQQPASVKPFCTIASTKTPTSETMINPVQTKVMDNKKTLPYDIIAMKKDDWI